MKLENRRSLILEEPLFSPPATLAEYYVRKEETEAKIEEILDRTFFFRIPSKEITQFFSQKEVDFQVGVVNGELKGRIVKENLRRTPFSLIQRFFGISAFLGTAFISYYTGNGNQGIVVKEFTKASAALSFEELNKFPLVQRILIPTGGSIGSYILKRVVSDTLPIEFSFSRFLSSFIAITTSMVVCPLFALHFFRRNQKGKYEHCSF